MFDHGGFSLARAAYHNLFEVLQLEDDYGRGVRLAHLEDVDSGEVCARYLRAVYETEGSAHRPKVLFQQLQQVQGWPNWRGPRARRVHGPIWTGSRRWRRKGNPVRYSPRRRQPCTCSLPTSPSARPSLTTCARLPRVCTRATPCGPADGRPLSPSPPWGACSICGTRR